MRREEIWVKAACAAISHGHAAEEVPLVADFLLDKFEERFPCLAHKTQFKGVPVSKLNAEQREEYRRFFFGVPA